MDLTVSLVHELQEAGDIHSILFGRHMNDRTLLLLDSFESHKTHKHLHKARIYSLANRLTKER